MTVTLDLSDLAYMSGDEREICMGVYNGEPKVSRCNRPYRSYANILSCL